jgi:Tfp pilus assembly protein PilE
MKLWVEKVKSHRGISLLELVLALLMMGVVTTAIFQLYITQHKNYVTQTEITNTQQNTRASIAELERQIRMAGYRLPEGMAAIHANNTDPDTITILYQTSGCGTHLTAAMLLPSSVLACATEVSCFKDSQWVYIYDPGSETGEWFKISHVQGASQELEHSAMPLSKAYPKDALVMAVTQMKFYVDKTSDTAHPDLMVQVQGQPQHVFAEDISDLEFRYLMKNGDTVDVPVNAKNIRQVFISVTGRSHQPDPQYDQDPYRHRMFTTAVYLRNVGI